VLAKRVPQLVSACEAEETSMDDSYRALLARGSSQQLIAALGLAWLSFGMVSLAIFLTAHRASGSYGLAGVTVAAFAVGSGLLAPVRGRLLDRRDARPWLPAFAGGYAIALLAFVGLVRAGAGSWALSLCAAVAGASAPPLVASIRSLWPRLVEQALVRRAYTLTSVVGDVGLAAAPALGGLLFVVVSWLPLAVCAISAVAAALVVSRVSAPAVRREARAKISSPLLTGVLRVLLAVEVALGIALGLVEVAVPATATRWGETRYSGFLLGAFALGSVAGGIWFGRRDWKSSPQRRYLLAILLLALALAPPIAATGAATLAPLLIISGLAYGPATISLFEALDAFDTSRATEALTWVTTAGAIGAAAGSAASGWAIGSIGLWAPFAAASLTLAVAAAAALGLLRTNGIRLARQDTP
jgi:MFS family permease